MNHFQPQTNFFIPHRLLFFADGGGPAENAGPGEGAEGGGSAVSEQAAERAAEERRQTAAAAKHQRKEEKKVKKRDFKLAAILETFLASKSRQDGVVILITRLLERNTPPSIILAVLSLNYRDVIEDLENYLDEERDVMPDDGLEEQHAQANAKALVVYGQEMAQNLSVWTRRIFTHCSFHPMKSIYALAHHHGVDGNMLQLTSVMIREYFQKSGQDIEFDRMRHFSELFWRDALKRLHHMADDRGLLPAPNLDPMGDEDDRDEDDDD